MILFLICLLETCLVSPSYSILLDQLIVKKINIQFWLAIFFISNHLFVNFYILGILALNFAENLLYLNSNV